MQFWVLTENVLFDILISESIVFYGYFWYGIIILNEKYDVSFLVMYKINSIFQF